MRPMPAFAHRACIVSLPTLVVDADPVRARQVLAALLDSGILDADVATSWPAAERRLAVREYDAVIAHESFAWEVSPLLERLEPDSDLEPLALILLTQDRDAARRCAAAPNELPGLGLVAQNDIAGTLIPRFQATLAAAGIRCRSTPFCNKAVCPRGY